MTSVAHFISRIYPTAKYNIGDSTREIQSVFHDIRSFQNRETHHIRIYDSEKRSLDLYCMEDDIYATDIKCTNCDRTGFHNEICISAAAHSKVQFLSDPNEYIFKAIQAFELSVFVKFMSVIPSESYKEFIDDLKNRWEEFGYFISDDPITFIMNKIRCTKPRKHSDECNKVYLQGPTFDGSHICDDVAHVRLLIDIACDKKITIHQAKDDSLLAVSLIQNNPQYVHITPDSSHIPGSYGYGQCNHPLTRVLFWRVILHTRPELRVLFDTHYRVPLYHDLIKHGFIHKYCDSIEKMVETFDTSICIQCMQDPSMQSRSNFCDHGHYNYHLLLLAVLQNGWHGTITKGYTELKYCGHTEKVEFEAGDFLSFRRTVDYAYFIRGSFRYFLKIVSTMITMVPEIDSSDDSSDN